jgi:5-methyltetrahydrofolate--homocysteine methyltransferase
MIMVGELINGSRRSIAAAIARRDAEVILETARRQAEAGAHFLDVNAGTGPEKETEDLVWLVEIISSELETPLCIDSPNPTAMKTALERAGDRGAMINSITAETGRLDSFLPLVGSDGPRIIALCMDDEGIPGDAQGRCRVAARLVEQLTGRGVSVENIYLDPLVTPVSVDGGAGRTTLETLAAIKKNLPGARTICGLSNISFGLPRRRLLNRNFLSLMLAAGLDAAILDPTDTDLMADLLATRALLGEDEHCLSYITASRNGSLTSRKEGT